MIPRGLPRPILAFACFLLGLLASHAAASRRPSPNTPDRPPNIVLIYADDLGYADVGCFGAGPRGIRTPNIDRLARDGIRFTDFYVAQAVCSASRAALLTGCYPNRVGISGALNHLARHGLNPAETTIAEVLKTRGYATGAIGKWHLGHHPPFLPTRQGFDSWFGLPYSNDMWPFHPEAKKGSYPDLPLYEDERIVDTAVTPEDQTTLTTRYTERAVRFIDAQAATRQPFFLYVAHSMPHVPLFVSDAGRGRSRAGLYGDVIGEIDASVGRILDTLRRHKLENDTLVLFTSDNGPWLSYGDHAGSSGPLREGKGTAWEGGVRVPFVARWPGHIPRGAVCREPAMTIDILPTLARIAGAPLPPAKIDGLDIQPLLTAQPGARSPHDAFWFYYQQNELHAIRSGDWKLILPHAYRTLPPGPQASNGIPVAYRMTRAGLELYNLRSDIGESNDVAAQHPDIVRRLLEHAETARADLGDTLAKRPPTGARPPGLLDPPQSQSQSQSQSQAQVQLQAAATATAARPNVVLIVADDLGAHDLAVTGSTFHETPNLDRLAAGGLRFTQAYSACTVCSPSRAAIQTGKYPARLKITDWIKGHDRPKAKLRPPAWTQHLPLGEITLAEHLKGAGFVTVQLGKWHLGGEGFEPTRQGYDLNLGGDHRGQPPSYFSPHGLPTLPDGPPGEYLTDREGNEAAAFIATHRARPFFLHYNAHAVHTPLQAPAESIARFAAKAARSGGSQTQSNATYAAMIERLDAAVGRILGALDSHGLADRTIVVFTSDNGGLVLGRQSPTSNAPLRSGKGSEYEGGHRVPLIVRWPGVTRPGSTSATPVMGIDILPTLLDVTGLPQPTGPARPDGLSLAAVLRDPAATLDRALYWHYPHYHPGGATPYAAIRDGNWKYIQHYEDGRNELFDLSTDPGETRDVSAGQPEKATALAQKLFAWHGAVGAQWPMPNPAWEPVPVKAGPDGSILLHSRAAAVRGDVLRYEPQPFKNTLGWWSKATDFAEWAFEAPKAGRYELDVVQGCGTGHGGSEVAFESAGQTIRMTVLDTGGFQNFTNRTLGTFDLPAGPQKLTVKPIHKPGGAVMDLREMTLRPVTP